MIYINKWKTHFLESPLLGQGTARQKPEAVLTKCIDLAYSDMMTAVDFITLHFNIQKAKYVAPLKIS